MKNIIKSTKFNRHNSQTTLMLRIQEPLTQTEMQKIRGGDGEGNGGVDIIIIPKTN